MQSPTIATIRRLSILTLLTLLFSFGLVAQVKIREKIEIAPKASSSIPVTSYGEIIRSYTLAYPAEVTLNGPFWRNPSDHEIWTISCNERSVTIYPSSPDDYEHPENNYWVNGSYGIFPQGTDLTFNRVYEDGYMEPRSIAEGIGYPWPDSCYGLFFLWIHNREWTESEDLIYIERSNFCPPIAISFLDAYLPSFKYMESRQIQIGLEDACGRHNSDLEPTPVVYHVGITSGQEWGYLYNQATGQTGDTIDVSTEDSYASFTFFAREQQPLEDQRVVLSVWSDNSSFLPATKEIVIEKSPCMILTVSQSEIRPGEKTLISVMQSGWDGIPTPYYPENQMFSLKMNADGRYGKLRCLATGDSGTSILGTQPFEFIAADSLDVNSKVVEIEAKAWREDEIPASIGGGIKDTLRSSGTLIANVQTKAKNIGAVPNEMKRNNIELSMNSLQTQLKKESAKKGNERQQQILSKRIEILKAQLAYETAKNPTEKQNSVASIKQTAMLAAEAVECKSTASITIVKEKTTCILVQPEKDTLAIGEMTRLHFTHVVDGVTVGFPAGQLFDVFLLGSGEDYGRLQAGSDTGTTLLGAAEPIYYTAPLSIDSNSIVVQFAAAVNSAGGGAAASVLPSGSLQKSAKATLKGKELDLRLAVIMQAQLECPIGDAVIVKPRITLSATDAILEPLGDSDKKDNPNCNKDGPDKRKKIIDFSEVRTTTVTITVKDSDNKPMLNYPFTLKSLVRSKSGGHDHTANRPTGRFVTQRNDTLSTVSDTTGSDGVKTFKYLSSGFGGIDSLIVKGKTKQDTATLTILLRRGNFVELTQSAHDTLIGQTDTHLRNHFGTQNLLDKIKALADSVYADSSYILKINDMSLLWGCPFDCKTDYRWNTPHEEHREGVSVDISDVDNNKKKKIGKVYFEDRIKRAPFFGKVGHEPELNHFHVTFR